MRAGRVVRRRLPVNSLCSSALTTAQALPLRQARQATMTVFLMNGCRMDEISASYRIPHEENDAMLIGLRYAMPLFERGLSATLPITSPATTEEFQGSLVHHDLIAKTTMMTALSATLRRRRCWKSVADPALWAQRSRSACIGSDREISFNKLSIS